MNSLLVWFGGRKATGKVAIVVIGTGVALALGDIPANLLTLLLGAYGLYVGGNVGSDFAAKKGATTQDPTAQDTNVKVNALFEYVRELSARGQQ